MQPISESDQALANANAIHCDNLSFDFGGPAIIRDLNLTLPAGSRCLLVGANGAGKSTLLQLLAGKRLVKGKIFVNGMRAFFDAPPGITYLGTEWAVNPVVRQDVPVTRLLKSQGCEHHQKRCAELLEVMDVDINWRMHQVSDGQRRRVQIVLGLLMPWTVLLLDEVTVDLDVVVRSNLLNFLKRETETRGATLVYATHIFDGLGGFPTHVAHIYKGNINILRTTNTSFYELIEERARKIDTDGEEIADNSPLLRVVERWLRDDYRQNLIEEPLPITANGKTLSRWDMLKDAMAEYGDKYFNYWN